MASQIPAVRSATIAVLKALFPAPVAVTYGAAGSNLADQIIGLGGSTARIERPTSANTRPREEIVETQVVFSVWTADATGNDDQRILEAAYTMLSSFSDYFKTSPNERLSGACRDALVTSYDDNGGVVPTSVEDPDSPGSFIVNGRLIEITAVLTSRARI